MKKILSLVLCFVFCLPFSFLVGCTNLADNAESESSVKNEINVGDEIPVYPQCEFDYKIDNYGSGLSFCVHIKSIKLTLISKNSINQNDVVNGCFALYTFKLEVSGSIPQNIVAKAIAIKRNVTIYFLSDYAEGFVTNADIQEDGNLEWSQLLYYNHIPSFIFYKIY